MGSPWVSYSPVFNTILNTISNNRDIVNNVLITGLILIDTTSVFFETIWDSNTTSDWTSLVNFLHHSLFSRNLTVLFSVVSKIFVWNKTWLIWHTVHAYCHSWAFHTIIMASSSIDWAGFISNLISWHPLESIICFTSMASIISRTRNKNLWSNVNIRPSCLSGNLNSIRHSWSSCMSPAWTTILWNMLVSEIGKEVGSIDIIPDILLWKILNWLKRFLSITKLWFIRFSSAWSIWVGELKSSFNLGSTKVDKECKGCEFHF